eukprot:TRINITY_DN828_c0_g1_i1.p1 TRINITY_DN828_c0_g1~~TRINITY_DN828_c0_g1_i1.p1  ORF type:complete len:508 (-),score=73.28 TRINITY_DN828_c0_g1_i1:154-1677(-)
MWWLLGGFVWTVGIAVGLALTNILFQKYVNRNRPLPHVTIPIVGDLINFIIRPNDWYMLRIRLYDGRARGYMWGYNIWLTGKADDIRLVAAKENKEVVGWAPSFVQELQGAGSITTLNGVAHTVVRKELFSLFSTSAMKEYFPSIRHFVTREVGSWASQPADSVITLAPLLRHMAFAAVYGSFIDMGFAEDPEAVELYEVYVKGFVSVPFKIPGSGLVKGLEAHQKLRRKIASRLEDARARADHQPEDESSNDQVPKEDESHQDGPDIKPGLVLDMLIKMQRKLLEKGGEKGVLLDDDTLVSNLLSLVIGGHDTVMSAMCSVMKLLAEHPDAMAKVREEVLSVCPDSTQPLTYEQVNNLHYCQAVIKESLRIVPPIHFGIKYVKESFEMGGYTVPKGDLVFLLYEGPHEKVFEDHTTFAPERFCKACPEYHTSFADDDRNSFLSFSTGARTCIGMKFALVEIQMLLAELMRQKMTWKLAPGQNLELVLDGIAVRYASGVQVILNKTA